MARATGRHTGRVEWMDTDAAGHHHNTAVNRFVESAEAALMRERGLPGYFGSAPRVHFEADYEARLWFGQEVSATVVLERVGRSSMTFAFEVWGQQWAGRPAARAAVGRFTTVHVPPGAEAAEPWPGDWLESLGAEVSEPASPATSPEPRARRALS